MHFRGMKNTPLQILIPVIIRNSRKQQKYSQEDLAQLANLDRTYISGVERGVRNLTIKSLSSILQALNMSVEDFAMEIIHENKIQKKKNQQHKCDF